MGCPICESRGGRLSDEEKIEALDRLINKCKKFDGWSGDIRMEIHREDIEAIKWAAKIVKEREI